MPKKKDTGSTNVVVVPKPSAAAYNPDRMLARNSLLMNQVRQFQHVEQQRAKGTRSSHDATKVETEGQAAEYVKKMTALMHERGKPLVRKAGAE
jgi:hypothetical protein